MGVVDCDRARAQEALRGWRGQWLAPSGARLLLRPLQAADEDMQRRFVCGLSRTTGYQRLLSPRRLGDEEIRRLVDIDHEQAMAIAAIVARPGDAPAIVGVARYVRTDADTAELAIVVTDLWQGCGLGTALLASLLQLARTAGLVRLTGITLADNARMQRLARRLGATVRADPEDAGLREVRFELAAGAGKDCGPKLPG